MVAVTDASFNVLANYEYDAWGNILSVNDSLGNVITDSNSIASINPLRYRGYYYDVETGFYYVSSRYYDPEVGRFINADDVSVLDTEQNNLIQYNLFTYCLNNPVSHNDTDGNAAANIVGGVIGGVAGVALGHLLAKKLRLKGWKKAALIAAATVGGAALGAIIGPYVAKLGKAINTAVKKASKAVAKQVIRSTGRTKAKNLQEQIYIKSVKSNPLKGAKHLKNIVLKDKRWSSLKGWIKMERSKVMYDGTRVIIHFVYNTITGKTADFKFK